MMKRSAGVAALLIVACICPGTAKAPRVADDGTTLRVVLLGTGGGPTISAQRQGIGTLVVAGSEMLLFDAGRGVSTSMVRLGINPALVTRIFITHLHSDHVISLPELWLYPWASLSRKEPLRVWGPQGTRFMLAHLEQAFAFDVHLRRDVDEKFAAEGIRLLPTEIKEGVVHEAGGARVTAFLVDHGPVKPAFGYRVDYRGHSVVLSGDTKISDNLIKHAENVDLLIHDVARLKEDPALSGSLDEIMPNGMTRGQMKTIAAHHTDAAEVSQVFARAKPRLAVISHSNQPVAQTLAMIRERYTGRVAFGTDLMDIAIGNEITIHAATEPVR